MVPERLCLSNVMQNVLFSSAFLVREGQIRAQALLTGTAELKANTFVR